MYLAYSEDENASLASSSKSPGIKAILECAKKNRLGKLDNTKNSYNKTYLAACDCDSVVDKHLVGDNRVDFSAANEAEDQNGQEKIRKLKQGNIVLEETNAKLNEEIKELKEEIVKQEEAFRLASEKKQLEKKVNQNVIMVALSPDTRLSKTVADVVSKTGAPSLGFGGSV